MTWQMIATLGTLTLNALIFVVIKFNDLKHIERGVTKVSEKVDNLTERIAKIEGILCKIDINK